MSEAGPSVEELAVSARKHARFMIATTVQVLLLASATIVILSGPMMN